MRGGGGIRLQYTRPLSPARVTEPRRDVVYRTMATPPQSPAPPPGIPALNASGTLPPYVGGDPKALSAMSPYRCTLTEMAKAFCTSRVRVNIFKGLLDYRKQLAQLGFVNGFQWLSGSYLEAIEQIEKRDPKDVDLVTFCMAPAQCPTPSHLQAVILANPDVFQPARAKQRFYCDPYFVNFEFGPRFIVMQTRYWFGLFSHRRDWLWKGLLEVPLPLSQDDTDAESLVHGLNFT